MIEAKTLRALAKHSGYKPSTIFRMQPSEILDMLVEKYPDIKEWDENKAKATIEGLTATPEKPEVVKESIKEVVKEEVKTKPSGKRTRRTKAQIAADKKAAEDETAKKAESEDKRDTPTRTRKKKKTPVPQSSIGGVSSEEIDVLKEMVTTLQEDVTRLTQMTDDISMFMAWFHNVKIDPREPVEHLASIDWAACISDQVKK